MAIVCIRAGDSTQLVECLACRKPWVQLPAQHKLDVDVHACNSSTQEVEVGRSGVQGHSRFYSEFKASLENPVSKQEQEKQCSPGVALRDVFISGPDSGTASPETCRIYISCILFCCFLSL